MREGIHPDYKVCKVTCACGNSFETKSMKEEMRLDVCSACHPFFTGQQKFINRGGRVENSRKSSISNKEFRHSDRNFDSGLFLCRKRLLPSVLLFSG